MLVMRRTPWLTKVIHFRDFINWEILIGCKNAGRKVQNITKNILKYRGAGRVKMGFGHVIAHVTVQDECVKPSPHKWTNTTNEIIGQCSFVLKLLMKDFNQSKILIVLFLFCMWTSQKGFTPLTNSPRGRRKSFKPVLILQRSIKYAARLADIKCSTLSRWGQCLLAQGGSCCLNSDVLIWQQTAEELENMRRSSGVNK